jgi:hypothetical protein
MPFTNDHSTTWVPPAELWQAEPLPDLKDPYDEDPYFPDPYAKL